MSRKLLAGIFAALVLVASASALKNPSAVYCEEMGYEFLIAETPDGQNGVCVLPDGSYVSAWWFLEGRVKTEYSYCAQQGYGIKTVSDDRCDNIINDECSVCVTPEGEVEVSELMGLNFSELVCGDGVCGMTPENYSTCPQDCPPSGSDAVCNAPAEGCDPDCEEGVDPDCEEAPAAAAREAGPDLCLMTIIILVAVALVLAVLIILKRRSKSKGPG